MAEMLYRSIVSDSERATLDQGSTTFHPTMVDVAVAFVNSNARYRQVVYHDAHDVRFLNSDEQRPLERVAAKLGHEVVEVDTDAA